MERRFKKATVIGIGKTALQCAVHVSSKYGIKTELYDANDEISDYLLKSCRSNNITYFHISKDRIFEKLSHEDKLLILSVYNPYIIPSKILDTSGNLAINLHHSFLPDHPGKYSEAWAIYDQDEYAGITWHIISSEVDKGDIIIQKKIMLSDDITAYGLLFQMNELAFELFKEFSDVIFNDSLVLLPQQRKNVKFHLSTDKPNNGELDLSWGSGKISAFLRANDYYMRSPFGEPRVFFDGYHYTWKRYKLLHEEQVNEQIEMSGSDLIIRKKDMLITLRSLTRL